MPRAQTLPTLFAALIAGILFAGLPAQAAQNQQAAPAAAKAGGSDDRHADYYYPAPESQEVYKARAKTLPEANRRARIGFVTNITNGMLENNPYPPQYAIFAKGEEAEKLIIVTVVDGAYNTMYRMRALLAMLTAVSRVTPIFKEQKVEDYYTFLDLLKMLGFAKVTISDGDTFSHTITLE
ncbi:MAG: molybdopterin-guanine dinucleotide biosynthesis protein A [Alphaproteobacteria bacterium]